jgi:putative endonuclease
VRYWIYILQSEATRKLYIGQTSDLQKRIARHNSGESGSRSYTHKQTGPWRLIHSEEYATRGEAMKRERFLKSGRGREWIRDNIQDRQVSRQSPPQADPGELKTTQL